MCIRDSYCSGYNMSCTHRNTEMCGSKKCNGTCRFSTETFKGFKLCYFLPIVLTILQPPNNVPKAIAPWQERTIHKAIGSFFVAKPETIRETQMIPMDF